MTADFKLYFVPLIPDLLVVETEGSYFAVPPSAGGWAYRQKLSRPSRAALRHWEPLQITAVHHHILPITA